MEKIIDYYYSPISPWSYMGHQRVGEIAKRNGVNLLHKPVNLMDIFNASGGLPLGKRPPKRQAYRMVELKRWRSFLNIDLTLEPKFFPVSDNLACKLIIACDEEDKQHGMTQALMRATWTQERDISDEATLVQICGELGLDGAKMLETAKSESVQSTFDANTKEANEADAIGAPTYVYQGEVFWGQDRLELLEIALKG